jgi:hypothetical protein
VEQSLADRPVVSWINLVEVYYRVARDQGKLAADETLGDLRTALAPDLPGTSRMIEVARLKARASIALEAASLLHRRGGRPPIGSAAASVESVRLEPELREALASRAERRSRDNFFGDTQAALARYIEP